MKITKKNIKRVFNLKYYPILKKSKYFDAEFYLAKYPDARTSKYNPITHYLLWGYYENRITCEEFDINRQLINNTSIKGKNINPVVYYEKYVDFNQAMNNSYILNNQSYVIDNNTRVHSDVLNASDIFPIFELAGANVYKRKFNSKRKSIAIFTHEMSLTGAPIAVNNIGKLLVKLGYNVVMFCNKSGKLLNQIVQSEISVIIYESLLTNNVIDKCIMNFDAVLVNTVTEQSITIINKLNGTTMPVFWWVHEAEASYYKEIMKQLPKTLFSNIRVMCVGERAKGSLAKRTNYRIEEFLYYVEDIDKNTKNDNGLINFTMIGTLEKRKGHEVLFDAINKMNKKVIEKCMFNFAGMEFDDSIKEKLNSLIKKYPNNVKYLGCLTKEEIENLYSKTDCLICCSKDDPMPIVVVEAWQRKIFTMCSENIGQKKWLINNNCGLVYENNDSRQLLKIMEKFIDKEIDIEKYINNASRIYKNNFSVQAVTKKIRKIIKETEKRKEKYKGELISIIIPVFNGGKYLRELLDKLNKQLKVNKEIICIDSGSEDESINIIKKNNCKLITIPKADFNHSKARNLGAKLAEGKYLLFMTQDALPGSDLWLYEYINKHIESGVAASSLKQIPRKEDDLFAKCCVWFHMDYMGIGDNNKICCKSSSRDFSEVRKQANLDDIACMHNASVFKKYKYRNDYAEDLDYGIRILSDGYKTGFYKDPVVIHSHNRNEMYFLKRGIIDIINLKKICKNHHLKTCVSRTKEIENKVLTLAFFASEMYSRLFDSKHGIYDCETLFEEFNHLFEESVIAISSCSKNDLFINLKKSRCFSKEFLGLLTDMYEEIIDNYKLDFSYVETCRQVIINEVNKYINKVDYKISSTTLNELCIFMIKKACVLFADGLCNSNINDLGKVSKEFYKKVLSNSGI